jgi:hypothetical protein
MRRHDKLKNIHKVNLLTENTYLIKKNPALIIESVLMIDESDYNNENIVTKWLFESMLECGISLDNVISEDVVILNEDKNIITESLIAAGIGVLLATGKFIDVMSALFKKVRNQMVKWGWLGKDAKTWTKTKGENFGDWWHKHIINPIFKAAAKFLLGIVGIGVTIFSGVLNPNSNQDYMGQIMSQSNVDDLASVLFFGTITALSLTAIFGGITELIHHGHIWTAIAERLATGTKFYELLMLVVAFFLATYIDLYKPFKSNLTHFAHALSECLEGDHFITTLKSLKNAATNNKQQVVKCVNDNLHVGHDEEHGNEHPQPSNGSTQHV